MTHAELLSRLTAKIVKAVPEIEVQLHRYGDCSRCWKPSSRVCRRDITLEDVLLAFRARNGGCATVTEGGLLTYEEYATLHTEESCWVIGKPLSEQSPETIAFLDSLLPAA